MKRRLLIPLAILLLGLAAVGWYGWGRTREDKALTAAGVVEAEEVVITSETGGQVAEILVGEGDEVEEGEVLLRLDTVLLDASRDQAEAALRLARANLAQVEAGAREAEIEAARAELDEATALKEGAARALNDARAILENPQDLELQIAEAQTAVLQANELITQAQAQLATAKIMRDSFLYDISAEGQAQYRVYSDQVTAAEAQVLAAEQGYQGAQGNLESLLAMRENPQSLLAKVHQAEGQLEVADAGMAAARANLERLLAGPRQEDVDVASAQVRQAEAALDLVNIQLEKMTLKAPVKGMVSSRTIEVGELASPGATLLTLVNLDEVKLVVYIPEDRLGEVRIDQDVEIGVDSFPGVVYQGRVVQVATEAEFTPRSVQTKEERVNTVFAVKISIPNSNHDLKPGMPADARFVP